MEKAQNRIKLWFDRALSKSLLQQFAFLGIVLVVTLGLSYLLLAFSNTEWVAFCEKKDLNKWLLPIYLLIDSNALNNLYISSEGEKAVHGWMLIVSSFAFLMGALIFNGAIIGMITNAIEQRVTDHREGRIHYLKAGHYIIMGYDDMVPSIIVHIFEKDPEAYVLLLSSLETEYIHERLRNLFDEDKLKRVILNHGHRISKGYFKDIHLESAVQVYIVGNRGTAAHDAINVECVDNICSYLKQPGISSRPKRICCVFEDIDTYAAFKTTDIFNKVGKLGIEFVPYNFYSGWAKQVFVKGYYLDMDRPGEKIPYPAVFGKGYSVENEKALTEDDPAYVHLVFVGTTNFAVAFAMEAAHVLHFPNFGNEKNPQKTLITFIDINAEKEKDEFITRNRHFFDIQSYRYRDLSDEPKPIPANTGRERLRFEGASADFLDVEFEFIRGDVFSHKVQEEIRTWSKEHHDKKQYLSIFLAQSNQRRNFALSMNMPDEVYYNQVPIFIRQDRSDNFVSNLRDADQAIADNPKKNTYTVVRDGALHEREQGGRYANIYPFGMNETAYSADEKSLERAKLINYLYCTMTSDNEFQSILALEAMSEEKIWSEANDAWRGLNVALKWSNLYSAYAIRIKLQILRAMRLLAADDTSQDTRTLSEEEVKILARVEHNRWNVEKLLMGYMKPLPQEDKYEYEEVNKEFAGKLKRNKERFIHHDIRPFDELDSIQKLDYELSKYIPWIIKMTRG